MQNIDEINGKNDKLTKGKKQVLKRLSEGRFKIIIIASDNESHFIDEIVKKCQNTGAEYEICSSKQELGKLCGIEVPCGVIGIEKD